MGANPYPVYNLSVLSNIPLSLANVLPENSPTHRLRPLFTIGVHDLPFLMEDYEAAKRREESDEAITDDSEEAGSGWVACTTDSILAMKDTLWDMLITMPPEHTARAKDHVWPTVECPRGQPVKATQRDVRRFHALRSGLARLAAASPEDAANASATAQRPPSVTSEARLSAAAADESFDPITEPLSWTALAYNGYMWWASAGEQLRSEEQEESTRDAALLAGLGLSAQQQAAATTTTMSATPDPASRSSEALTESLASLAAHRSAGSEGEARLELAVIAYFHRLTTQMLSILGDVVDSSDESYPSTEEDDDEVEAGDDDALLPDAIAEPGRAVTVDSRSVENMGLDVWSTSDGAFVQALMRTYFGRAARIEGKGVEVCGVRVC